MCDYWGLLGKEESIFKVKIIDLLIWKVKVYNEREKERERMGNRSRE